MAQKKYEYKHLNDEMKKILDKEIKAIGRDELYERVSHNIEVQRLAQLQNEKGAFKEIFNGPWRTTQWEYKFFYEPVTVDTNNLSLEQEMLHYIDKKKFLLL